MTRITETLCGLLAFCSLLSPAAAQEHTGGEGHAGENEEARRDREIAELREQNAELSRRIDLLAGELERLNMGDDIAPPIGTSEHGLGPAASKIYGKESGLSIGGYGEFLYEDFRGGDDDQFDALRAILYFGYKFDDKWLLNTEIEIEHATTSENPDGEDGEVSLEFAYLDYLHSDNLGFRGGLVLLPMGLVNELHEPTTFLSATRPRTEQVILPTTWRENGVGVFGEAGPITYRSYIVNGFDASGYSSGGLRGGRQKGGHADAEDLAWVGRVDWTDTPGLLAGFSAYYGDAGQELDSDATTTILDAHVEWKREGWHFRALGALAEIDDADDLNAELGNVTSADLIGEELEGWYVEVGYDLMSHFAPGSKQSLTPFVRYEEYDTQAEVQSGFSSDPSNDNEIITFGVSYMPNDNVVIKLDFQDRDNDADNAIDQLNFAFGYIF